jgi:hypothetical protein
MKAGFTAACLLMLCVHVIGAQNKLIYRERTGQKTATVEVWEEQESGGTLLRSTMSYGESYAIWNDDEMATTCFSYGNKDQDTAYTASREGNAIRLEGTLRGTPFVRRSTIDARPLYESVERSLQGFAISGSRATISFWIVLPTEAIVFLLTARREGREVVDVGGRSVDAEKVKVSLPGLASILWSSLYWYRPDDGTFLRSESVRSIGIAGMPKTVLELIEGERL